MRFFLFFLFFPYLDQSGTLASAKMRFTLEEYKIQHSEEGNCDGKCKFDQKFKHLYYIISCWWHTEIYSCYSIQARLRQQPRVLLR